MAVAVDVNSSASTMLATVCWTTRLATNHGYCSIGAGIGFVVKFRWQVTNVRSDRQIGRLLLKRKNPAKDIGGVHIGHNIAFD
jgi:hypothetical protein